MEGCKDCEVFRKLVVINVLTPIVTTLQR